jgi:hypothetical protein
MTSSFAMTKSEHKVAKERIEANYKMAKAKCDELKDNAKDVCMKEAKGTEDVAKAELEQQYKPSAQHSRKVAEEKAKMRYEPLLNFEWVRFRLAELCEGLCDDCQAVRSGARDCCAVVGEFG